MCNRYHELNVSHTLAANLALGNLNAATVANNALVADAFVLTAVTLPVLHRSEYLLTEESVTLRLEGSVIYCLGFQNLAMRLLRIVSGEARLMVIL